MRPGRKIILSSIIISSCTAGSMAEIREAAPVRNANHSNSLASETRKKASGPVVLLEGVSRAIGTGDVSFRMNSSKTRHGLEARVPKQSALGPRPGSS